ncbi:exported hypothetical protein [Candidatus Zixiibacteriota bacterium]|nr:exported hypothetical protein [candidate division Zixibacteria bacterium]
MRLMLIPILIGTLLFPAISTGENANQPKTISESDNAATTTMVGRAPYVCGDANNSGSVQLADISYLYNFILGSGASPVDYLAGNADGVAGPDTIVNIADCSYLINYIYYMGPAPFGCSNTGENWQTVAGNKIRVGAQPYTAYPGNDSVAIPVYITNSSSLTGLTAGFHYTTTEEYKITSVDWTGSVFSPDFNRSAKFDTIGATVLFGGLYMMSSLSAQNDALLVKLNARSIGNGGTGKISLEKAFVRPAGEFIFVSGGSIIVPDVDYSVDSFKVINLDDDGPGSLRFAITNANASMGLDTIDFSVSGMISLATSLPAFIDDSTVILGSTAPSGDYSVIVDGSGLSGGNCMVLQSRNCRIEGLTFRNFPANAISITGPLTAYNTITNNLFYDNTDLGIDLNNDGVTINDPGDADSGPNDLLNYPEVDSVYINPDSSFIIYGRSAGKSRIEFFVAHPAGDPIKPADPSGHGEAYSYIGFTAADPTGAFTNTIPNSVKQFSIISTTATDTLGNTSEFSDNFTLTPGPLIVVAYSPVNLKVTDPDGYYIGKDADGNLTQTLIPATYVEIVNDSINIPHPIWGRYTIEIIAETAAPPNSYYGAGIRIDGSNECMVKWNEPVPDPGQTDTVTYNVEEGYHYLNADANDNGTLNILDVSFLINYLYRHGPEPYPLEAGDANCNGKINILDVSFLISYLYKHGPEPCRQ